MSMFEFSFGELADGGIRTLVPMIWLKGTCRYLILAFKTLIGKKTKISEQNNFFW